MRTYVVQPGDTPASIAAQDDHAGCPKCSVDLIAANPHKPTRTLPNGYVTFRELRAEETLNLPDKWFDGTLDRLPKSYFAALPHPNGVTPGKQTGVGAAFPPELVAAAQLVDAAIDASTGYCDDVARPGTPVNSAVHAFKVAWNATQPDKIPINTGNYETPTAEAVGRVLGTSFEPCTAEDAVHARNYWAAQVAQRPAQTTPVPITVPRQESRLSVGDMVGYGLLSASVLGGGLYLATRKRRRWH